MFSLLYCFRASPISVERVILSYISMILSLLSYHFYLAVNLSDASALYDRTIVVPRVPMLRFLLPLLSHNGDQVETDKKNNLVPEKVRLFIIIITCTKIIFFFVV